MADILKLEPDLLLPKTCWYSSKTKKPRDMKEHLAIGLHKISGRYAFPEDPFNLDRIIKEIVVPLRVSYHVIITRNAEVRLWVPLNFQAFHAGSSRYKKRDYCNQYMIGIGMVSTGKPHEGGPAFTQAQVEKCAVVSAFLIERYEIDKQDIVSHEIIRNNWNRKHPKHQADSRQGDPGDFPYEEFYDHLEAL